MFKGKPELVLQNYWWKGLTQYVNKYINGCQNCPKTKIFKSDGVMSHTTCATSNGKMRQSDEVRCDGATRCENATSESASEVGVSLNEILNEDARRGRGVERAVFRDP